MIWKWFVGACLCFSVSVLALTPSFEETRRNFQKSDALLLDRNGVVLQERRVSSRSRTLDWISINDISPAFKDAVLVAEDHRFYAHHGVDYLAMVSAAWTGLINGKNGRGASTLSMQVASFLRPSLQNTHGRKTLWQKWMQMEAAWELEKVWSKAQIFEAYLNVVSFRGELHGIAAAARGIFGKSAHGLDEWESVVLASLIRAPNATVEKVTKRACALERRKKHNASCGEIEQLVPKALGVAYSVRPLANLAPHVAQQLLPPCREQNCKAESVRSTLRADLQSFASQKLKQALLPLKTQNVQDGAVLVADNQTGEVLAYVGNTGDTASQYFVDGVKARRQAGSILKPFLYALAFEKRLLTPASVLDDSPLDIPVSGGVYRPQNYDSLFHGRVTSRIALASSLNVPAVKTLLLVKIDSFLKTLQDLDFGDLKEAEIYGPSLALGSADITLWEVVRAYRALAHGGVVGDLMLRLGESRGRRKEFFRKKRRIWLVMFCRIEKVEV